MNLPSSPLTIDIATSMTPPSSPSARDIATSMTPPSSPSARDIATSMTPDGGPGTVISQNHPLKAEEPNRRQSTRNSRPPELFSPTAENSKPQVENKQKKPNKKKKP